MDKDSVQKLTPEQLDERRKQVVGLHKKGIGVIQIVDMTGLSYAAVRVCLDLFESGS